MDSLIRDARRHDLHLVLLWLASWKNGMSSYQPLWAKADYKRFPRAARSDGSPMQFWSTLSENNWKADGSAFAALMHHLRDYDQCERGCPGSGAARLCQHPSGYSRPDTGDSARHAGPGPAITRPPKWRAL